MGVYHAISYCISWYKKGKNLFGGIVIPKSGSFWICDKTLYEYDKALTGWKIPDF